MLCLLAALLFSTTGYATSKAPDAEEELNVQVIAARSDLPTLERRAVSLKAILACIRKFYRLSTRAAMSDPTTAKKICDILRRTIAALLKLVPGSRLMRILLALLIKILRWLDCLVDLLQNEIATP